MAKRDLVGIVTVTFNSATVIADFMSSLLQQTYSTFVLYLIDNASTDSTLQQISYYKDPRIKVTRNPVNLGVAEGNNIGIRAALKDGCAAVLFVNNDTAFESDLLARLREGLEEHECEMTVPKILFYGEPKRIWSAGAYFSWLRGSARHFGYGRQDKGEFDRPRVVSYGPTCCLLVKKRVFERIGLMDASYFVYFDDTDFCFRAYRAGIKLFYIPSAQLLHKVSSLTGSDSVFSIRHNIRNHVYYLLKNFPRWSLLYYLPAFQAYIFAKFMIWMRNPKAFWLAERAFKEGFSHFHVNVNRGHSARELVSVQSGSPSPQGGHGPL
jgi:GT2 family glycosyltransferase